MEIKMSNVKVKGIFDFLNDDVLKSKPSVSFSDTVGYGVKMIHAQKEWKETMGAGINIAILDTGIDFDHQDLKDRVKGGINFTSSNPKDYMDRKGHGTHCAGIIAASLNNNGIVGVAPEANLFAVKILGDDGAGSLDWIIKGIEWCINNDIHIISMSLGTNVHHEALYNAIKRAYDKGVILVAASGNDGDGGKTQTIDYPGFYQEVIAVSAIDANEVIGDFSSTGSNVVISAAGVDVLSTYPGNKYAKLSGTSMACPHISGAIALMLAKSKIRLGRMLTNQEVLLMIKMLADDTNEKGKDDLYGFGVFTF